MPRSDRLSHWLATVLFVGVPAAWAVPTSAHVEPGQHESAAEALIAAAEILQDNGQHLEAAEVFVRAYDLLPEHHKTGPLGEIVAESAGENYAKAYASSGDRAVLEASVGFLRRYLAELPDSEDPAVGTMVRAKLSDAEAELGDTMRESEVPVSAGDADPAPADPPRTTLQDTAPASRRKGLGLTIGGGLVMAAGAVMLGLGGRRFTTTTSLFRERKDGFSSDCTRPDGGICALNGWKNREYAKSRGIMAPGGILAAAGLGMVVAGAVILARPPRSRSAALVPVLQPGTAALSLSGRF